MCIRDSTWDYRNENKREDYVTGKYSEKERLEMYNNKFDSCLLYTSDAADERSSVDLGGRRIIKKKNRLEE